MKTSLIALTIAGSTMLAAGTASVPAAAAAPGARPALRRLADTRLGRFITGQVGRMLVLRSRLNVTPEQREQIAGILKSHRQEIARALKPVVEKRRALREAVLAEKTDERKVRSAAEELGKAIGDAAIVAARIKSEARGVLTDEQVKVLAEFRADRDGAVDGFLKELAEEK